MQSLGRARARWPQTLLHPIPPIDYPDAQGKPEFPAGFFAQKSPERARKKEGGVRRMAGGRT